MLISMVSVRCADHKLVDGISSARVRAQLVMSEQPRRSAGRLVSPAVVAASFLALTSHTIQPAGAIADAGSTTGSGHSWPHWSDERRQAVTDRRIGDHRPREVAEQPGIRPFLQQRTSRRGQCRRGEHLPDAQQRAEVRRISQAQHFVEQRPRMDNGALPPRTTSVLGTRWRSTYRLSHLFAVGAPSMMGRMP
jgi:hypothetical protein